MGSSALPATITIHTLNKCGHGFISTSSLQLKVRRFPLVTFTTFELISGRHILQPSLTFKQSLFPDALVRLLPCITCHIISSHTYNFFRFDFSKQNTSSEIWVLIILEVENNRPAPESNQQLMHYSIVCTYEDIRNTSRPYACQSHLCDWIKALLRALHNEYSPAQTKLLSS